MCWPRHRALRLLRPRRTHSCVERLAIGPWRARARRPLIVEGGRLCSGGCRACRALLRVGAGVPVPWHSRAAAFLTACVRCLLIPFAWLGRGWLGCGFRVWSTVSVRMRHGPACGPTGLGSLWPARHGFSTQQALLLHDASEALCALCACSWCLVVCRPWTVESILWWPRPSVFSLSWGMGTQAGALVARAPNSLQCGRAG